MRVARDEMRELDIEQPPGRRGAALACAVDPRPLTVQPTVELKRTVPVAAYRRQEARCAYCGRTGLIKRSRRPKREAGAMTRLGRDGSGGRHEPSSLTSLASDVIA